jgi:hypothetical protein
MQPTDWVELAFGYDRATVKVIAEAELARVGVNPSELTNDEIRVDVGTDTEFRDFFRVSVRRSILLNGGSQQDNRSNE